MMPMKTYPPKSKTSKASSRFWAVVRSAACNHRGETITEVLVAMVIAGLALLMLATTIAASTNLIRNSRDNMDDYYNAGNKLVQGTGGETGTITLMEGTNGVPLVDVGASTNPAVSVTVQIAESGNKTLASYEEKTG